MMLIMVYLRSGTLFNTIDRTGDDIVDQLDWQAVWDVDNNGDGSPDITFEAADFDDAVVDVSGSLTRLQRHLQLMRSVTRM